MHATALRLLDRDRCRVTVDPRPVSMPVRDGAGGLRLQPLQRPQSVLRLPTKETGWSDSHYARRSSDFPVVCVVRHQATLHESQEQIVEELRRARHHARSRVAAVRTVRDVGEGEWLRGWAGDRPSRQRRSILTKKLPVDSPLGKPAQQPVCQKNNRLGRNQAHDRVDCRSSMQGEIPNDLGSDSCRLDTRGCHLTASRKSGASSSEVRRT